MFLHVPPGTPPGAPVVLALPGCGQSAEEYLRAGWNELADRAGFLVVYAEQRRRNNPTGCFNWFLPGDSARGSGEPLSLVQMVEEAARRVPGGSQRVFVTGTSAGGAMAAVLLAAYPDVFAGGAILAAGPYGCAASLAESVGCLLGRVDHPPEEWGDRVRAAFPGHDGPYPRVSLWHGTDDRVVDPVNLRESAEQWRDVHGLAPDSGRSEPGGGSEHVVYRDAGGTPVLETHLVRGLGHAAPVDPGPRPDQGGEQGEHFADVDLHSTYSAARFLGLVP